VIIFKIKEIYIIILPKHCEKSSRRTGQIPVSRACRCCKRISNCSCKLITSRRVAGVDDIR